MAEMLCVEAEKPFGPDHACVYGPVPPVAVMLTLPSLPLAQLTPYPL